MGFTWEAGYQPLDAPTPDDPQRCSEDVEADVRVLMSKHAAIQPRGFDTIRIRGQYHARIDTLLDEYAMRVQLEALT